MKFVIIGAHLRRDDIEPVAAVFPAGDSESGIWLSGVAVEDDQPLGDRDLLLLVAAARARLLERATFIAIRYGFAARTESEAAARCAAHVGRWRALLQQHRHEVEMTLKVAAAAVTPRPSRVDFSSGAGYLRALHDATRAADIDPAFRTAVDDALRPTASLTRWIHRDNASVEFAALVPRHAVDAVREAGESLRRNFPRVPFLLSGPWPLEVFADADHQ